MHYVCGWPTRAWYEGSGRSAPEALVGLKPTAYHEYQSVPMTPRVKYDRLTPDQKLKNRAAVGTWVWD